MTNLQQLCRDNNNGGSAVAHFLILHLRELNQCLGRRVLHLSMGNKISNNVT